MSFEGQHVYVMGGSYGVGEATARAFAAAGAEVVITSRSKERLEAAAARIGHPVQTRVLDATDPEAVAAFCTAGETIDHLVLALSPGAIAVGPLAASTPVTVATTSTSLRRCWRNIRAHLIPCDCTWDRRSLCVISTAEQIRKPASFARMRNYGQNAAVTVNSNPTMRPNGDWPGRPRRRKSRVRNPCLPSEFSQVRTVARPWAGRRKSSVTATDHTGQ